MVTIRNMVEADTNFVFDSWLKSWRKSRYAGVVQNDDYYATYRKTIERLIMRGAEIKVACNPENENHILGYLCYEITPDGYSIVHFLYVKDPFLKQGIEFDLLSELPGQKPGFYSFNTQQIKSGLQTRWPEQNWQWSPEIGRRK